MAVFTLHELDPGTRYVYEVYLDGRAVVRPYPLEFETKALWRWRRDPPDFAFMFGSCAYVNDPPFDRPGTPYGSDHEIFTAMAAKKPAFMLWVGDNTYTREVDFHSPSGLRYRYRHDRALPVLQPFLASTHHYATWDDHDYGPNDSDGTFALKDVSLEVFKRYWPAVSYGLRDTPGVFQRFLWNDVELFLVDDRYHRSPAGLPESPDDGMLGRAQLDWLKAALHSSAGAFKIVAVGSQALNPLSPAEGWRQHPRELAELLDFIRDRKIEAVLFLSGDRHRTELMRVERPGLTRCTTTRARRSPPAPRTRRVPSAKTRAGSRARCWSSTRSGCSVSRARRPSDACGCRHTTRPARCAGSASSAATSSRSRARRAAHTDERRFPMIPLVLLRHGESTWNQENRFTGWTDVDLTDQGIGRRPREARPAAPGGGLHVRRRATRRC